MDQNKKELRKSLAFWKKELRSIVKVFKNYDENSFIHQNLLTKKEETENIIKAIEKQLGAKNEQ